MILLLLLLIPTNDSQVEELASVAEPIPIVTSYSPGQEAVN